MAPEKKTAFLIIHGVGPHSRYQVCDVFAQGFLDEYRGQNKDVKLRHLLKPRKERIQSCISLYSPDKTESIDCYEYFWDIHMVHKVLPSEAWDLLLKASKNAKQYYDKILKDPEVVAKYTDLEKLTESPLFRKRRRRKKENGEIEFRPDGYLRLIGGVTIWIVKIIPYIPIVIKVLEFLSKMQVPIITPVYGVLSRIFKTLAGLFQNQVEKNFMGDVVRYLDMDPRSKYYETRQKIINGAVDECCALMQDDYDQIIIIGHSLGSVIAYDALNRIILQINAGKINMYDAEKIKGFVTFGSPLDKIAFFFREYIASEKQIQRKIIADMHTFRTRSLLETTVDIEDPDPFYVFPEVRWLNFWHPKDLISGKLDLYDLSAVPPQYMFTERKDGIKDGNIRIDEGRMKFLNAHSSYWGAQGGKGTSKMQEAIIKEFFPIEQH
jgi:hypothetical protein